MSRSSTFRSCSKFAVHRYEAEGADGLYDRRLGRLSGAARAGGRGGKIRVLELFDTRYIVAVQNSRSSRTSTRSWMADHGCQAQLQLAAAELVQAHGRRRAAPRRGAHRRKRPRRALPGMMLHQDCSSHEWVPGRL